MHIAYVTETEAPDSKGLSLAAERTTEYLRGRGHRVEVVRPRQQGEAARDDKEELRTSAFSLPMHRDLRIGFARSSALAERFARARPHLIHVATQGPLGWAAVRAAKMCGIPVTSEFKANLHQYGRYYGLGFLGSTVQDYLRHFHNQTQRTFVPTRALRRELADARFERLEVIGRGVDTQRFTPEKRSEALRYLWGAGPGPVLLYVGRLAAEKNATLALCAFEAVRRRLPSAQMVVVGDGPQRKKLQEQFPAAQFVGAQRGEALAQHYASADMFVSPGMCDTFGSVTLEALASGLPVVAFDTAAASEYVEDCTSGLLVSPGDDLAFVAAVCSMAWQYRHFASMREGARESALRARWDTALSQLEASLLQAAAFTNEAAPVREACVA